MNKPLKILLAAPTKIGRTRVGLNLGQALTKLGYPVSYFDYDVGSWSQRLTPKPLRDKIAYYLGHEEERLAIAQAGREHFLRHHSYATQAKLLLETISA